MRRSDFGVRSVRHMVVRVYTLPTLLVATEVRAAGSVGDARATWACAAMSVTNQAHRLAVLYAAPLPFRECFLQLESPPLARFARTLHNFPWLPLATTCRDATGFFDWHRATPELDVRALLQRWRAMPAAERAALVHRRVEAALIWLLIHEPLWPEAEIVSRLPESVQKASKDAISTQDEFRKAFVRDAHG
jgi:hypothetical protein